MEAEAPVVTTWHTQNQNYYHPFMERTERWSLENWEDPHKVLPRSSLDLPSYGRHNEETGVGLPRLYEREQLPWVWLFSHTFRSFMLLEVTPIKITGSPSWKGCDVPCWPFRPFLSGIDKLLRTHLSQANGLASHVHWKAGIRQSNYL